VLPQESAAERHGGAPLAVLTAAKPALDGKNGGRGKTRKTEKRENGDGKRGPKEKRGQ
jgi:hypothetical protein